MRQTDESIWCYDIVLSHSFKNVSRMVSNQHDAQ